MEWGGSYDVRVNNYSGKLRTPAHQKVQSRNRHHENFFNVREKKDFSQVQPIMTQSLRMSFEY